MLVSAKDMLTKAFEGHYAVGQFNINNLEWTKAILQTAQECNSPVILGVSEGAGKYMCGFNTVAAMVTGNDDESGSTAAALLHIGTPQTIPAAYEAPGEHDARDPLGGGKARGDKRAGDLEQEIPEEEDARACAVDFRREPAEVLLHREGRIRDVHAVEAGDDGDKEHRQYDAEITLARKDLEIDGSF